MRTRTSHGQDRIDDREAAHARFLRGLAHEVRTPLGSILMLTELLADGPEGLSEKQQGQVRKIRQAAAEVSLLLDQVSTLAKVADGGLTASPSTVDLEELVGLLRDELASRDREKGRTVEVRWEQDVPKALSTDGLILRQVLVQLLEHALGATRDGAVSLVVARHGGEVVFAVRDQGAVVPEDRRDAIFEPFPPAGVRTRRSTGGTALALPLARELAGLLGGRLELESGSERGVTLTLLLPVGSDPNR
jgi:signal transduction histidine kinase